MLGQDRLGGRLAELDPHDGLESAREANRQPMSTGVRVHPCRDQNRSTARGRRRVAAAEPGAERRAGRVVVDDHRDPAPSYDAVQLGQAGLGAGPEEVGPAGVDDVDGGVGDGQRLGGAGEHRDAACAGAATGERDQVGVGLDAGDGAGALANRGRWKPVPQPMSRTSRPDQPDRALG